MMWMCDQQDYDWTVVPNHGQLDYDGQLYQVMTSQQTV